MTEIPAGKATRVPASPWQGRDDGPGREHARWWSSISTQPDAPLDGAVALVGFACDEGVRRNQGRPGAFDGPRAIRAAMGSLAFHHDVDVVDLGDVVVAGQDLEGGQELLGETVGDALKHTTLTVVLGGGHETAYGTHLGLRRAEIPAPGRRLAIINLDAHFDLRRAEQSTSGTPFRQMADELGDDFHYTVVGISEPNNTNVLFDTARELGVRWLVDEHCTALEVTALLDEVLENADDVHLSIDLDVLPGNVAPGVSQPAAFGVALPVIVGAVRQVATSGKLRVAEIVEISPTHDFENRTAALAGRLVDTIVSGACGAAEGHCRQAR